MLMSNSQAWDDLSCWLGHKPQHKQPTKNLKIHEKHTDQPFLPQVIISQCSMRPSSYAWIWKLLLQGWTGVYLLPSDIPFSFFPALFSLLPLSSSFTHPSFPFFNHFSFLPPTYSLSHTSSFFSQPSHSSSHFSHPLSPCSLITLFIT